MNDWLRRNCLTASRLFELTLILLSLAALVFSVCIGDGTVSRVLLAFTAASFVAIFINRWQGT